MQRVYAREGDRDKCEDDHRTRACMTVMRVDAVLDLVVLVR